MDEMREFLENILPEGECLIWTGGLHGGGYGSFKGSTAHRWAYRTFVGEIPSGLVIDHLCQERLCVNPAHLEAVTNQENLRRGRVRPAPPVRFQTCPQGHESWTPSGKRCPQCYLETLTFHPIIEAAPRTPSPPPVRAMCPTRAALVFY